MIYGIFHPGSGLGNMLHRYVATRVLAEEKGYEFSMVNPEGFKGKSFMNLDMGVPNNLPFHVEEPAGKIVVDMPASEIHIPLWEEWNKNVYDPDINFVEDHTIIDGNFEDERYFENHLDKVDSWLNINLELLSDFYDQECVCIIGFRGGEYYTVPELGLPKEYYDKAIKMMLEINPAMHFEVHTDDIELAKQFFPDYKIVNGVAENWSAIRVTKYAIIANSSFYVLPRLLKHRKQGDEEKITQIADALKWAEAWRGRNGERSSLNEDWVNVNVRRVFGVSDAITIAPRYWNRYNTKKWDYPQGYYKQFIHI